MHPFPRALADFAAARALFLPGDRVLVAASGGPDSCALLLALAEAAAAPDAPFALVAAAHFHHGMRGAEADGDAALVEALARRCGIGFQLGRGALAGANEADARAARYDFLTAAARACAATAIATGHTADDQAETILLRVLRGTSPDGLAGIPVQRRIGPTLRVVRPLLERRRAEVLAYLGDIGVAARHDPTNDDPRFPRSRVRRLVPALADDYNPRLVDALCRLADHAAADRAFLEDAAEALWSRAVSPPLTLDRGLLRDAAPALRGRVLLRALRRAAEDAAEERAVGAWVARLERLLVDDGAVDLPGGVRARTVGDRLQLERAGASAPAPFDLPLPVPGSIALPDGRTLTVERSAPGGSRGGLRVELSDTSVELRVRSVRDGDRLAPLGMRGRTRAVRDTLRDAGVDARARVAWPLVVDARTDAVLWVVGVAQAESTRVNDGAAEVVALAVTNP